jgi:hypothetical protein
MRSYKGSIAGAVIASSRVAQFLTAHPLVAPSLTLPRGAGEGINTAGKGNRLPSGMEASSLAADRGLRTADRAQRSS